LYSITKDKGVVVSQVENWNNNKWSWKVVEWRRSLFAWEVDEEARLMFLLEDKALSVGVLDKWVWKLDESSNYFVSSAYSRLRLVEEGTYMILYMRFSGTLRLYHFSMTTTWRVLTDRLSTRENLVKRELILESNLCVQCEDEEEYESHVFFKCKVAWKVWSLCSKWIGGDLSISFGCLLPFQSVYLELDLTQD